MIAAKEGARRRAARPRTLVLAIALAGAFAEAYMPPAVAVAQSDEPRLTSRAHGASTPAAPPTRLPSYPPKRLEVRVVASYPHDPEAFTQGLLLHDGKLYESTGRYGRSSLRQVDLTTGAVIRRIDLPDSLFGEGLARVGKHLIQLTWRERLAQVYDLASFETVGKFSYATEGWGLCFDGKHLIMSDGSHRLYFRDPETFAVTRQLAVTLEGQQLSMLNEFECVGDTVYANVWPTERIVQIYKRNGVVKAVIHAASLLSPTERAALASGATLNGIAYDEATETFLVTGKLWPKLFRVRFVPAH